MKSKTYLLFLYCVIVFFQPTIAQPCQIGDSLELIKLHEATKGASWMIPWNLNKPVRIWNGVKVSAYGRVTSIVLQSNNLVGNIPNLNLASLRELKLGFNQLQGTIPDFLQLPQLKELYLSTNQLTGTLPKFSKMPALMFLDVSNNQLSGNIPEFSLLELEQLNVSNNQFSGTLPPFSACPGLKKINVMSNKFAGNMPDFAGMVRLEEVNLSYNQFSGELKDFNIYTLERLDLSNNKLVGTIPNFKNLPKLRRLYLQNNRLMGPLPDFNSLPNVTEINVANNRLNGALPSLKKLGKLLNLNVSKNAFTFDGVEHHVLQPYTVTFTPQDSIELYQEGNKLFTQTVCKDSSSYFAWYRNDTLIGTFARGNATLTIKKLGKYRCMLKNANQSFALSSKVIRITEITPFSGNDLAKQAAGTAGEILITVEVDGKYFASLLNEKDEKVATKIIESQWEKEGKSSVLRLRFNMEYTTQGKYMLRLTGPKGIAPLTRSVLINEKGEWFVSG
ncbi:MAG: leucine-rich repeat domain-containing protein [Bacteroidia bacterium]